VSICTPHEGYTNPDGYGEVNATFEGVHYKMAHRLAWAKANGPIPEGLKVLHRCDNPPCVNVEHLFLGTHLDNMADMTAKRRHRAHKQDACGKCGSEFNEENTRVARGWRICRVCERERMRRARAKKVAA
jgi:hypothetical protein